MPRKERREARRQRSFMTPVVPAPQPQQRESIEDILASINPPEPEPSGFQTYGPAAIRGLGGLFGITPPTGAAAGAISEAIAQAIEGDFDASQIGAATAVGATGGGLARSLGTVLRSASTPAQAFVKGGVRGALYGGAQPIVHDLIAEGELPTVEQVGQNAVLGGVTAGGLGALFSKLGLNVPRGQLAEAPPTAPPTVTEVVPNVQRGGRVLTGGRVAGKSEKLTGAKLTTPQHPSAIPTTSTPRIAQRAEDIYLGAPEPKSRVPVIGTPATASGRVAKVAAQEQAAAAKAAEEARAAAEIQRMRDQGLVPTETVSESFQAPIPGGKERGSRVFRPEVDEDGNPITRPSGGKGGPKPPAPLPERAQLLLKQAEYLYNRNPHDPKVQALLTEAKQLAEGAKALPSGPDVPPEAPPSIVSPPKPKGPKGPKTPKPTFLTPEQQTANNAALLAEQQAEGVGLGGDLKAVENFINGGTITNKAAAAAVPETPPVGAAVPRQPSIDQTQFDPATGAPRTLPSAIAERLDPETNSKIISLLNRPPVDPAVDVRTWMAGADPLTFHKGSRVDVAGEHYRALKALLGADPTLPKDAPRLAGRALQTEARAAGLPTRGQPAPQTAQPQAPVQAPAAPAQPAGPAGASPELRKWLAEQDKLRKPGGGGNLGPSRGGSSWGGQRGAINPELAASLGLGAAGAATGAVFDPLDNPVASAIAGGIVGLGTPMLISKFREAAPIIAGDPQAPPSVKAFVARMAVPGEQEKHVRELLDTIPAYIRGSLLFSPNILNNAVAAPLGSGFFAGLELHLAGDPRGLRILQLLQDPNTFRVGWPQAVEEANRLIGAAEGTLERAAGETVGQAPTMGRKIAALPGTAMTTGDVFIRNVLKIAGLTDDEARRFTMTNEPEWGLSKTMTNFQRSGYIGPVPVGPVLAPFVRTLANVVERGAERTPIVGSLFQLARNEPDPLKRQLVQQAIGGATGTAGFVAGYNDPYEANSPLGRFFRSFVSNSAGPYALLSGAGFAAGHAARSGKRFGDAVYSGVAEGMNALPLPSTDIPLSYAGALRDVLNREIPQRAPSGAIPGKSFYDLLKNPHGERGRQRRKPRQPRQRRD